MPSDPEGGSAAPARPRACLAAAPAAAPAAPPPCSNGIYALGVADGVYMWKEQGIDAGAFSRVGAA